MLNPTHTPTKTPHTPQTPPPLPAHTLSQNPKTCLHSMHNLVSPLKGDDAWKEASTKEACKGRCKTAVPGGHTPSLVCLLVKRRMQRWQNNHNMTRGVMNVITRELVRPSGSQLLLSLHEAL